MYVGSEGYGDGYIDMQIAAFDVDTLADGSGKAPITWISKELLRTSQRMNPQLVELSDGTRQEGTGAIGGWEKSELRAYMIGTIKPLTPALVRAAVKPVTKTHSAYNTNRVNVLQTTTDEVWLPSHDELWSSAQCYPLFQNTTANRIKKKAYATGASAWWLRSVASGSSTSYFNTISDVGDYDIHHAASILGVVLGFCT